MSGSADAIAIVGMACRFPGASDVRQYWANLTGGVDSISRFGPTQLRAAGVDERLVRHPDYVAARGEILGGECFDREFFGYSPATAASIDPQHRVFLEVSSGALDDSGIDPSRYAGLIGVFAGCDALAPAPMDHDADELAWLIGQDKDFLATRVAYKLGLRGPAVTVQTACSTSLVAVHTACQSLLGYECDAALAGGVSLCVPQAVGYVYQDGHILSRDGRCRPFDAGATGTVPSSGVGVVVLRRLADALSDGDRVVAVIRGSAINNDGGQKVGYTTPSVAGQRDVIRFALAQAGAEGRDIGYVEAHGTGTRVGDPVEVAALTAAFRESTEDVGFCWLGAVKGNIGHTSSAAGVASLIKTALVLERRTLVPTVHFEQPNPELELDTTPFRVCAERRPWDGDGPALAGVSSFGIGGTNAHAVLEAPPSRRRAPLAAGVPHLLCVSAATPAALDTLRGDLAERLDTEPPRLDDAARTLADGRRTFASRLAVVAESPQEAARALRDARPPAPAAPDPTVAFLFPGQGTLGIGAGRAAHELLPAFGRIFDAIAAESADRFGVDLGALLDPGTDPSWSRDAAHQQLGLFAVGYALAGQFQEWGVRAAAMLGNSVGEYVAAAVAGVWTVSDTLTVLWERGLAMREARPGRMLAVTLPREELAALAGPGSGLTLAIDATGYGVLAGDGEAVEALRATLTERGTACRLLDTERAFHSPSMRPAAAELRRALAKVPFRAPTVDLLSNLTGTWAEPDQVRSPAYWADQTASTVRLADCAEALLASRCDVFVELGDGQSMIRALRRHHGWSGERLAVPLLGGSPEAGRAALLSALGRLWERGLPVGVTDVLEKTDPVRCALPAHPLARTAVPWRTPGRAAAARADRGAPAAHPLTHLRWAQVPGRRGAHDGVVVVGPCDGATTRFVEALARAGAQVRRGPADAFPWPGTEPLGAALDGLAAGVGSAPALVADLSAAPDIPELADQLDELADRARRRGVTLVVLARRVADLPGGPPARHRALLAWARHRSRVDPPGSVRLLDLGDEDVPQWPPASPDGAVLSAWHGGCWWALTPEPVPEAVEASPPAGVNGAAGPFAVVDLGTADGAGTAAELAAHGLPVAAFVPAAPPEPAAPPPAALAGMLSWQDGVPSLSRSTELRRRLDTYCAGLVGEFVCGRANLRGGDRVDGETLRKRLAPAGTLPRMVDAFLRVLTARGWFGEADGMVEVAADIETVLAAATAQDAQLDEVGGLRRLLRRCVAAYPEVFDGECEPAAVLFPDGQEDLLREHVSDNQVAISDDEACLAALCEVARAVAAHRDGRPLRVLEVGGGGGELTWRLLDGWGGRPDVRYHFTDISPLRVRQARERCAAAGMANVRCETFDITRDPVGQGLAPGTFDLVVAYNVVHLAPSVRTGLEHLRRLLAPGGLLGMVELATVPLWMTMIWGLAPGWWGFDDDVRGDSVHIDPGAWESILTATGLGEFAVLPHDPGPDHLLVLAREVPGVPDPAGHVAAELRRQAPGTGIGGLLGLAGGNPQPAGGAADRWAAVRGGGGDGELPLAWLVSEDTGPEPGWRGERYRRDLDPPGGAAEPPWRHVEVHRFGAAELAALPDLLRRRDVPPVTRLAPQDLRAAGALARPSAPAPAPASAPASASTPAPAPGADGPSPHGDPGAGDQLARELAAIWCDVLGLPTAGPADDFFELGGDSLTAVHLTARIRERLGRSVPLTAFSGSATFAGLLELAHAAGNAPGTGTRPGQPVRSGPSIPDDLLVLREGGTLPPLFLAAPATGSSLCYRRLARLLGDRPCYGIESPGLHDGRSAPESFEEVAAHHVEVMRRVRQHGPYLVGGWSVGAMVAHEMARQLTAAGEEVPLVVCVDAAVVDTNGWPLAVAPGIAGRGLWYQLQVRLPRWARGARQQIAELVDLPGAPDFGRVFDANIRAMLRYQPRPAPTRAIVFSTGGGARARARLERRIGPMYQGGVEIRPAPGDHWTVLGPAHVETLAQDVRQVLAVGSAPPAAASHHSAEGTP